MEGEDKLPQIVFKHSWSILSILLTPQEQHNSNIFQRTDDIKT